MAPKISVLVPLYNRREFARDCIQSVLAQSFSDFELVIRDDCSTDGVYEFVAQNFSDARIRLYRNEKNLGEAATINLLVHDAAGKYLAILHNDDMYLPNALENLYAAAEKFSADVVHASIIFIRKGSALQKTRLDKNAGGGIVSAEPLDRFNEWFSGGIFRDVQYNLFAREFALREGIFADVTGVDPLIVSLLWIMKARVLVRTPEVFYVRRENAASQSGAGKFSAGDFSQAIEKRLEVFRRLDEIISRVEFFKDKPELQYKIKARIFGVYEDLNFDAGGGYGDAKYVELYGSIENVFRKHFGDDAVYLALLYHWAHATHFNQTQVQARLKDCLKLLEKNI
ncbi:MAG: glycosyltransferase family 2 protein [Selenomonadaceae bacterium]|nr:glycosyltransferase family 2 protein [Selenomonadaceae bacterium]